MQDIEILYNRLKEKYDFTLTNAYALQDSFMWDIPVICGKSAFGEFRLYAEEIIDDDIEENVYSEENGEAENAEESVGMQENCAFIFYLHYEKQGKIIKYKKQCVARWALSTIDEAVAHVDKFMDGTLELPKRLHVEISKKEYVRIIIFMCCALALGLCAIFAAAVLQDFEVQSKIYSTLGCLGMAFLSVGSIVSVQNLGSLLAYEAKHKTKMFHRTEFQVLSGVTEEKLLQAFARENFVGATEDGVYKKQKFSWLYGKVHYYIKCAKKEGLWEKFLRSEFKALDEAADKKCNQCDALFIFVDKATEEDFIELKNASVVGMTFSAMQVGGLAYTIALVLVEKESGKAYVLEHKKAGQFYKKAIKMIKQITQE